MNNNNTIIYCLNTASHEELNKHLARCSSLFQPNLDTYVNIKQYAKKIFKNAFRLEAWDKGALIGLLAVYLNNTETREGFITNVSVEKSHHGISIGKELLEKVIKLANDRNMRTLSLSVNKSNIPALNLYKLYGFTLSETIGDNLLMKRATLEN